VRDGCRNPNASVYDRRLYANSDRRSCQAACIDPKRFKSGEELASYAGLVPKQMQSGEMNRLGHITHRGPGLLRSLLVEAAWTIYRHNAWAQVFVNKISHGSKAGESWRSWPGQKGVDHSVGYAEK
jgi:hypothetical protein